MLERGDLCFVFVNGDFDEDLSCAGNKRANISFEKGEFFIEANESCSIKIVNIVNEPGIKPIKTNFFVEKNVSAKVYLQVESESLDGEISDEIKFYLKENSKLDYIAKAFGFNKRRQKNEIFLQGDGAEANVSCLSVLEEKSESNIELSIKHLAKNTLSSQICKEVLHENSSSSFAGEIFVARDACGCEAHQLKKSLVMGDNVSTYGTPSLKILSDDVKVSHGITVGNLDENELFYCLSRGIVKEEAKGLLVESFCQEFKND